MGLYVPGGTASYPSSVLMNAMPARVAGVPRIVMVVPTPDNVLNPLVLAAARLAGVGRDLPDRRRPSRGGVAYGTATIAPVAKIVGPGNAWVAAAKRRVFGQVGIDMIAGPSEVLILADGEANPDWIAADLLAQPSTTPPPRRCSSPTAANWPTRESAVERALATLPRAEIARASWRDYGAIIRVRDFR